MASKKISELPAKTNPVGADEIVLLDSADANVATKNKRATLTAAFSSFGVGGASNIWIAASQMIPRTTSGCGVNSSETGTNKQNYDSLDFDTAADEFADALIIMPNNWDNGTVKFRPYWTADSGSGTVCFALQGRAYADDDAIDTAAGTAQTSTDTLITAGDMHVGPESAAITIGGAPAANKPVQITVYRDISEDTLGVDARILGIEISYSEAA